MVSIAHWLDTFTCSKYADRFERSGFQNLQSVCQLTTAQLQSLGVASNDIYTIMENVLLLKQSLKSLEPPRYLDLNSELPSSTARSRTASPAINALNRTMSQNPTSYSPGPHVSTPPASSGPSPDRGLPGPAPFDTPGNAYHRSNSYTTPVNPNTFLDMSPSSSTSSPHRSGSMDAYAPPPMDGVPFNEYSPQLPQQPPALPPHPHPHPQFQPPGMMYRPGGPPPLPPGSGGYYNPHAPRFFPPDHPQQGPPSQLSQQQGGPLPPPPQQQQSYMYSNPRMMMHPQQHQGPPPQLQQQHPPWAGHRPPPPPSHPMHYHPYDQHQYRMPPAQPFHPNHPMMSDQSAMFLNQQQGPPGQSLNPSTSSKLSPTGEPHPHPLQSLERLVLLPESQVIDPKSVVNEIHEPPSPFSESLSPYGTSSPKNSVSTPPTTTMVSNLLTNDKSMLDPHTKAAGGLKRGSTYDDRTDVNKKNRMNINADMTTGESITNNHPVVTSLLTRGLSSNTPQAPLPSIKSLQQKHNPSFLQQQQQQQHAPPPPPPSMMFPPTQPDPQQFVDGLMDDVNVLDESLDVLEQDYEQLMTKLRIKIETTCSEWNSSNVSLLSVPCQFDGLSEGTSVTSKATNRGSRKRLRSGSSEGEKDESGRNGNSNSSPLKTHQEKSSTDPCELPLNGSEKKSSNGSFHRRLSETHLECNHSSKSPHSSPTSPKIEKPKVIQSPRPSNFEQDESSSVSETTHHQASSTTTTTSKPIREAKKRSLIYTGNTREFLETAIAAGLIDANGDEEDEDNEYVPPGGSVAAVRRRRASSPSSSSSNSDQEQASTNDTDEDDEENSNKNDEDDDDDDDDEEEEEEGEVNDENLQNDEPSESNVTWNVRSRPQRRTHLIRFDNISEQDEQKFFGALQEQAPELAAFLNEDSDQEYQVDEKETEESPTKVSRKSATKKSQRSQPHESSEQDEQTVEIIKKFRHVRVPSEKKTKRKSHHAESTTISSKNRSHELYVLVNDDDSTRTIVSGSQLETNQSGKKSSPLKSFYFHRRPVQMNNVEDPKAPYRCVLCWKEPYEDFLGPLFGAYQLNEQCQTYLSQNKQLGKHYRKLKEAWFHRDCALWNNHIQMNPTTGELMNVSEACSTYLEINCSICQQPGAALACRYRNCKIRYHYACAKATNNCRLISQSYAVYCPKHNQMINQKSKKNRRQTTTSADDSHDVSTV